MNFQIFKQTKFVVFLFSAIAAIGNFTYAGHCGLAETVERYQKSLKEPKFASTIQHGKCDSDALYDSVYTKKTEHFQIMYVLKGPNATTKAFVDTVAKAMEDAWHFHVDKLKMLPPKGRSFTEHYQMEVESGLYPVEIVNLDNESFGSTEPEQSNTKYDESQISLENDFYYESGTSSSMDTIFIDGEACPYRKATTPIMNYAHNFSYAKEWAKAIRLTSYHELYHAVQLRYLNIWQNFTFWFEASASGMEEIAMPEIDDYQRYLAGYFRNTEAGQLPISTNSSQFLSIRYGNAAFFLYLYNHVSHSTDKEIWESFSRNQNEPFEYQFSKVAEKKDLKADSIFHNWAISLSFSGENRSATVDSTFWVTSDQSNWPICKYKEESGYAPSLNELSYSLYRGKSPNLQNFTGKATVILFNDKKPSFNYIYSNNTIDSLQGKIQSSDSLVWVFSRFDESSELPIFIKDSTLRAYPTPWRSGSLCFTPLPLDKKFIEIRNRRGDLVLRENYEQATHCLSEEFVKAKMRPGLYHYRLGNKGKLKDLLIIY